MHGGDGGGNDGHDPNDPPIATPSDQCDFKVKPDWKDYPILRDDAKYHSGGISFEQWPTPMVSNVASTIHMYPATAVNKFAICA